MNKERKGAKGVGERGEEGDGNSHNYLSILCRLWSHLADLKTRLNMLCLAIQETLMPSL